MMNTRHFFFSCLMAVCCLLLSGCALNTSQPPATRYDFGPVSSVPSGQIVPTDLPALVVSQVSAPDWLNSTRMYYRLAHVNEQQTLFYTLSSWNAQPSKLFRERFHSRIVAAGGETGDGVMSKANQLRLIIHLEDFSQYFLDDSDSKARIALRVSVPGRDGSVLRKSFFHQVDAPTPDAAGGAKALSVATDEVITQVLDWIVENHKKGEVL